MTLEQSLRDLCAKHGLDSLSIQVADQGRRFYSFAQRVTNYERCGVMGGHCDTIAGALTDAITKANANRTVAPDITLPDAALVVEA